MNNLKSLLCFSLLLLFVVSAKAQEDRTRFGFGVGFGQSLNINIVGEGLSGMTLPIDYANFTFVVRGQNFRLEPNFGVISFSETRNETDPYEPFEVRKREESGANWRIGAVIAYANAIGSMKLYYGINVGAIFSSSSREYSTGSTSNKEDATKTDFFIGPAIGGEYMFSDNFSLGGEIQINYISVGQFDWEMPEGYSLDVSTSIISTRGMVILRWYVN